MGWWGPGPYWSDGISSDVMYVPISGLFCVLMYPDLMMFSCIGWPKLMAHFPFILCPLLSCWNFWNQTIRGSPYFPIWPSFLCVSSQLQSDINRELETKPWAEYISTIYKLVSCLLHIFSTLPTANLWIWRRKTLTTTMDNRRHRRLQGSRSSG